VTALIDMLMIVLPSRAMLSLCVPGFVVVRTSKPRVRLAPSPVGRSSP
jgi:hypothetical protein